MDLRGELQAKAIPRHLRIRLSFEYLRTDAGTPPGSMHKGMESLDGEMRASAENVMADMTLTRRIRLDARVEDRSFVRRPGHGSGPVGPCG